MKEDIIHKLEASGARAKISIKTMNGEQTHLSTAVDRLEVASKKKRINKQWIKVPKCYTTSDLPIDAKEVASKKKRINKQWIKVPKCYTTSDLPIDAKEVATKEKLKK